MKDDLGALCTLPAHCPNVSHLSISSRRQQELDIENICRSYGRTLLVLNFENSNFGNAGLARISEACPNASIDCIQKGHRDMAANKALALGRTAVSWRVSGRDADFDDSLLSRIGKSCVNLQRCSVTSFANAVAVREFSDLFILPKPNSSVLSCMYQILLRWPLCSKC